MDISKKLAAADPSDAQAQLVLSVYHDRLGNVLLRSGQVPDHGGRAPQNLRNGFEGVNPQLISAARPAISSSHT